MSAEAVSLRPATAVDANRLFEWVNAPDSLRYKERTTAPIAWLDHVAWLDCRLADPETAIFIIERDGVALGQVRLEPADGEHQVDIYLTPESRKRGLALAALRQAIARARVDRVVARVKSSNLASKRLFCAAGFVDVGNEDTIAVFRLELAK